MDQDDVHSVEDEKDADEDEGPDLEFQELVSVRLLRAWSQKVLKHVHSSMFVAIGE